MIALSRTLVLRNPEAGTAHGWEAVGPMFTAQPGIEVLETVSASEAEALARQAAASGVEVVVATGGDGTIHSVVQGLLASDRPPALGIIPMGTGNDTIRSLGIPSDPIEAVRWLQHGERRAIDLMRVEVDGRAEWCINACSGGFSGEVTSGITEEVKRIWGRLSYARKAVENVVSPPCFDVELRVDDGPPRTLNAYQVIVGNGSYMGGGLQLVPSAEVDDGKLDVVVVRSAPIPRIVSLLPAVLRGEEPDSELFHSWQGTRAELRIEPAMTFSLDGEIHELTRLTCEIAPGALEVLVPSTTVH